MSHPDRETLASVTALLAEFDSGDQACGYLAGRIARHRYFVGAQLRGSEYRVLLDANFRRSGFLFYRPECAGCSECRQMRVVTAEFEPSKSQRRCMRRNTDLELSIAAPELDDERVALYEAYVTARHGGVKRPAADELESFLYRSAAPTLEVAYRTREGRLVAVSIVDFGPRYLSSVYHYFDPAEAARSLGVFSVLAEIELARDRGLDHYYLGYLIPSAQTMAYKANYRPFEWLVEGEWRRVERGDRLE
jgi:leucyl-tRNA---protein transferase